jgi:hypothetical protein
LIQSVFVQESRKTLFSNHWCQQTYLGYLLKRRPFWETGWGEGGLNINLSIHLLCMIWGHSLLCLLIPVHLADIIKFRIFNRKF